MLSEYPEVKKYQSFEPRPATSRNTSHNEINQFLISLQNLPYESNWEAVPIHYDNYEISDEKYYFYYNKCDLEKQEISFKTVLCMQVHKFIANLKSEIDMYEADKLTNHVSCHITGRDSSIIFILSRVFQSCSCRGVVAYADMSAQSFGQFRLVRTRVAKCCLAHQKPRHRPRSLRAFEVEGKIFSKFRGFTRLRS